MQDIFMLTLCNHRITNYELDIQGDSRGNYTAKFPFPPIQSESYIYIRSWEDEQLYMKHLKSYKQAQPYVSNVSLGVGKSSIPVMGANKQIGIGGYAFIDDLTIRFDAQTGEYRTVYPDKNLVPQNKYLVDFYCTTDNCPRCNGTGFITDLAITSTGNFQYVSGADKIKQRVVKALIQPIGSCLSDPSFGSELQTVVGTYISDELRLGLQVTIMSCLQNLITNQPTAYTDEERIVAIKGINIETKDDYPDAFFIRVIVTSAAGEEIDCSVAFKVGE